MLLHDIPAEKLPDNKYFWVGENQPCTYCGSSNGYSGHWDCAGRFFHLDDSDVIYCECSCRLRRNASTRQTYHFLPISWTDGHNLICPDCEDGRHPNALTRHS